MDVRIEITGTTPLMCHNPQLADPDNEFSRQISAVAGKRKKTEEDRRALSRLEWWGGLYLGADGQPVVQCDAIKRSIEQAATMSREGKAVQRGLVMKHMTTPIIHGGAKDLEALLATPGYLDRRTVVVGGKRIVRTRPCFPAWSIVTEAVVITDKMDLSAIDAIIKLAGSCIGIGDARVKGFGRYEGRAVRA